jgi:flagellar hook-length control protein FliK
VKAGDARLADAKKAENGQSFASMLSQELRGNAADLVKTGSIVLRNNNEGLIRLTLHPESLGNVKISLELSDDKRISGKIVVSSREAYEAFNENLDGLSKAFVDGGFESAGFDLSWSGQDSSGNGRNDPSGAVSSPFYASSIPEVMSAAEVMSASDVADRRISGYRSDGNPALNVFA